MLDLKSLLVNAGLTPTAPKANKAKTKPAPVRKPTASSHAEKLKLMGKPEQYTLIRKWVNINRLDKARLLDDGSEKFYFHKEDNSITWLSLDKGTVEKINSGEAAIISYMSNSGLSHAVVPREIAEDIRHVFPAWIRVFN